MSELILTGFHAVEERVRNASVNKDTVSSMQIFYSKPGPRIKKILEQAKKTGIAYSQTDDKTLDDMTKNLGNAERDHRGIVIRITGAEAKPDNIVDFDNWLNDVGSKAEGRCTVVVLDSVTDPHNVGAILRSADQFGASLVIMPERHSSNKINDNDVIQRSSAGAASWVTCSVVTNLVRCVEKLKSNGFWVYGADAGGTSVQEGKFADRTVLVMGSEGTGISRLLKEQCDSIVSIPTCGKIDSLNVSVATGILLYEIYRQAL
ncbi:MAG: 23S rRNA (guanosine(2251)-2'-O)-methyltransferase RlmB [Treponema sp.]|uniref:23S rRNA (guanosine(2251)-2'-O)-methyltransferase RlmB n=1 Tax=Treponema sp. TaxID=166 RepID=UPI001D6548B4|nr:23S rRNA (guanosine(2251)-2'-O)-methyltransferase RlmB [Treponema sp.]MBS7310688.1 23S rRNA (guanosine(2251)-2'-O)-methyltransferase RlmB [Treponema sp.]